MKTEEKEIKIDKMVLNIEGEKVSLTMDQAKKLKKILDELFGKEVIKETIHEHHYDYWWKPYYIERNTPYWKDIVYCSSQLATGVNKAQYSASCLNINL